MSITATELKINLGKYLMLAETEDIYITRNGKVVAKLSNPYQDRVDVAKSLFGVLSNDMTHRLTHSDAETRRILGKLFTLFHLLDTTSLDCRKAMSSEIGDYEDAIMVETAIRSEMDCIVTRNVKDYAKSSTKVYEPSALIKLLEEENEAE